MSIRLSLPRESKGQEVLDAFRDATLSQESTEMKWVAYSYSMPSDGVSDAEHTFLPKQGYIAQPNRLRQKRSLKSLFQGRKEFVWERDEMTHILLRPLAPTSMYSEVSLEVLHEYDPDPAGGSKCATSPDDPKFAPFRPVYDQIVRELLRRLG